MENEKATYELMIFTLSYTTWFLFMSLLSKTLEVLPGYSCPHPEVLIQNAFVQIWRMRKLHI